ncbi:MAG: chemotaxis protein CheA [Dehalococcoidia bacterium]|nr:chemotaxis protein CheA [Dehalococcoidia bacterium]
MSKSAPKVAQEEAAGGVFSAEVSTEELKVFIEEADEQIALLDRDLVRLETEGDDPELIQEIFRATHTMKGSSAMLGYTRMSELAHSMESLLDSLRSGRLSVSAEIVDSLLYGLDVLKVLRDSLVSAEKSPPDIGPAVARLESAAEMAAATGGREGTSAAAKRSGGEGSGRKAALADSEQSTGPMPDRWTQHVPQSVRVDVKTLDSLMNMVEELVIDRSRISQINRVLEAKYAGDDLVRDLSQTSSHVIKVINELQQDIMQVRMVPIGTLFNSFPRLVRDLAQRQGKKVEFTMEGLETELDRSIIEQIRDPLIHLLRNAVDHGVEDPEKRVAAGKPPIALVRLSARQEGGHIVISMEDDGKGIDVNAVKQKAVAKGLITADEASRLSMADAVNLVFMPGFSTLEKATEVSGRGVGLDVVKTNIEKLSGSVVTESRPGEGTKFMIVLPLTLAVIQGLLVSVGGTVYVMPLASVTETLLIQRRDILTVRGRHVIRLRNNIIPLLSLDGAPGLGIGRGDRGEQRFIVVAKDGDKSIGVVVDELMEQQEFVVKPLGKFLVDIKGIAGATILGDGQVGLILDVPALIKMATP